MNDFIELFRSFGTGIVGIGPEAPKVATHNCKSKQSKQDDLGIESALGIGRVCRYWENRAIQLFWLQPALEAPLLRLLDF